MSYPEINEKYSEDFWTAMEVFDFEPKKAERLLKKIITKCKDGHIDAILHLGLLYNEIGKEIEGNALVNKAHNLGLEAIPNTFDPNKDEIRWGILENRPLLRTFHAEGLELMKVKFYAKAIEKFEFIINVNPGDNQGARYSLAECYFYSSNFGAFFHLNSKYPDDHSVEFFYGNVFAYFQTNNLVKAKKQLQEAIKAFPHVANELIKTNHSFPYDEFEVPLHGIPVGSRQEAFNYWARTKDLWNDKKIISFIKEELNG